MKETIRLAAQPGPTHTYQERLAMIAQSTHGDSHPESSGRLPVTRRPINYGKVEWKGGNLPVTYKKSKNKVSKLISKGLNKKCS